MIVKAGEILGIPVLDHIIVSSSKGISIRNKRPEIFNWVLGGSGVVIHYILNNRVLPLYVLWINTQ